MKTNRVLMLAAAAVIVASAAHAQLKITVPFKFHVDRSELPAGTYNVSETSHGASPTLTVTKLNGDAMFTRPSAPIYQSKDLRPRMVFRCGSAGCSLAELWDGDRGYHWSPVKNRGKESGDERIAVIYGNKSAAAE